MTTLVARLAGPLQAWGADATHRIHRTHATPTWSGLLGLTRAALGHGRDHDLAEIDWLRALDMAIRVDQPGIIASDFHTISQLPAGYTRFDGIGAGQLGLIPRGNAPITRGNQANRWMGGTTYLTERHYLHDATFLWLTQGPEEHLHRLATALTEPRWALSLGRKACPPTQPFVLGLHAGDITQTAAIVPDFSHATPAPHRPVHPRTVELIWIHGTPPQPAASRTTVADIPLGPNTQHGHGTSVHHHTRTTAPHHEDPLDWAATHLTRLDPEPAR